jgi:sporulation protein YlmC with PRC-barrel domain
MTKGRKSSTSWRWIITSTTTAALLGLGGPALGDDDKPIVISRSAAPSAHELSMGKRWQKCTELMDKKVVSATNESLGEIKDIVVDPTSGRILYGVLEFGGFLGMGEKLFAIPWQSLDLSGDNKAFTLNVDKDRLKAAPGFDKKQWPNFADEQWATTTHKFYNVTPYWVSQADADKASANYRWNQRATAWQKCSDLHGKGVVDAHKQDIGKMADLAIDPDCGRILYGVLSFNDKLFAVPWGALTLPPDAKTFALNANKDQLKDSIGFGENNWPNLTDPRWATETHEYFHVRPYWTVADAALRNE